MQKLEYWFSPFAAVMLLMSGGCVSQKIEPEYIPRVSTTQNNQGMVTISWPSRVGYTYRLSAEDQGQVHVDRKEYMGTGDVIEVEFMRDPSKRLPDYRVIPEKIKGR
jgi:hypothetical protein